MIHPLTCLKISGFPDTSVAEDDDDEEQEEQRKAGLVGHAPGPPNGVAEICQVAPYADAGLL